MIRVILAASLLATCAPALADRPDPRFAGAWRIEGAVLAPWATREQGFPDEVKHLVGQRVVFAAAAVGAPSPLGCAGPRYRVREADGPEMLFEGGLAGSDGPPPNDPAARARALGMTGSTVQTLEVGCSDIAYHAIRPGVLMFALDNQVYTLRRRPR